MGTPFSPPSRGGSPAPAYRRSPLRVGCVQFDVKDNVDKVETMTAKIQPGSLDLLVLPEMALSGYIFNNPTSILPYLEQTNKGPTSNLLKRLAKRIGCHVIAGYPESLESNQQPPDMIPSSSSSSISINRTSRQGPGHFGDDKYDSGPQTSMKALEGEALGVGYNSAMVVNPNGEVIGNYRKTFRFDTDKNWAREGDGFKYFDLGGALGRTVVGICMDMNPKDFVGGSEIEFWLNECVCWVLELIRTAPWDAYELANFCRENKVDTLVVPMNWLDPPNEPPDTESPPKDREAPSESNLNYWAARLQPLHDPAPGYSSPPPSTVGDAEPSMNGSGSGEVVFISCNRVGTEEGSSFVGTSCVMTISSDPSRIELVECCNMSEERVMLATVT